ncbi:2-hydroxyacid dehydrogenase [Pseudocolwellia sp. AS88]|uniref:2-hydroxyacid dehydrogenase n=1 Tax=Pseudocolwellia sp. AS88 TaxID=3063958 RepID=UPI0026F1FF5D|nr:2-hydroxyacid dehydrogenase [Pseudocolwellia sp. AS88]MDO7084825.1 2-hydroxyacid dehydrogenase [Pseudocolwellia sp. AS88]
MKICMFSSKAYDEKFFSLNNSNTSEQLDISYFSSHLNEETVYMAEGFDVVCCFVNDNLNANVLKTLKKQGIQLVALRCAGFNNVDLKTAKELSLPVCRVPEYSPYAVAEHTCALVLDLNRNIHRAHNRIRENDYSLDGLLGFDLHSKTVGVVGAGKIGRAFINIINGFGCNVLVYDPMLRETNTDNNFTQVTFDELLMQSDIISLHCPLTTDTQHLINTQAINKMKPNVMLINTSRGALVDTVAIIKALKLKQIGYLGIDVYEEESEIFFEDLSDTFIQDDVFARLQTFPNVTITGHQAFFTKEALNKIAQTTISNIQNYLLGKPEDSNLVS